MSDDGFLSDIEEPNMAIRIKTLLGTSFDMKVSSTDTIGDIKRRIYRIEGIPIYQQSLIFQSRELKDLYQLGDLGIKNGSTLTLVSAMRGGPISTRRLSVACDHHIMLKELKELLENTREEITPGSKVSVLVFKEGDVINLLRVIENEDGSYSPYSEKPISPPSKPARRECRAGIFEKLVEDNEMSTKIANLKKKMQEITLRRQSSDKKIVDSDPCTSSSLEEPSSSSLSSKNSSSSSLSYKLLSQCGHDFLDSVDLKIYEKNFEEENEEEIALKEKHRSKLHKLPKSKSKSLYSESKGAYSHARQNYARIHKKSREISTTTKDRVEVSTDSSLPSCSTRTDISKSLAEQFAVLKDEDYSESLSLSMTNRIHLTRLVLSETSERPKSSPDSIELEENAQDLWEIHEPASERLKHSATCKVGLVKRRTSHDYGYEGRESSQKSEISNYSCKNSNFEVCSSNFYQFAPPQADLCDYYFSKTTERSPLYGRTTTTTTSETSTTPTPAGDNKPTPGAGAAGGDRKNGGAFSGECSSIQRLKNDGVDCDNLFALHDQNIDDLYGYYNLGCSAVEPVQVEKRSAVNELPPVIKKRSRCSECNKRLNITNIYDCRCGRIFCSQHRYSEVHRCTYDYKHEGRKLLKQQNPLVAAEKVAKI